MITKKNNTTLPGYLFFPTSLPNSTFALLHKKYVKKMFVFICVLLVSFRINLNLTKVSSTIKK